MRRRDFLKRTAGVGSAASISLGPLAQRPVLAQGRSGNPVLVVIFLRGGQDQLSTIVPYSDRADHALRPTVAVPAEAVIKLDDKFGLHPALEPLKSFYDEGRVAPIVNSGSRHPTRSHFDAQDFMEYAAPGNRTVRNGWLNRYLQHNARKEVKDARSLRAVAMQELLPRSMRGEFPVVAVPPNLRDIDEVLDLFDNFYGGNVRADSDVDRGLSADPVMSSGRATIDGLRRLQRLLYGDDQSLYGARTIAADELTFQEYPGHWFATRMKAIAKLIKADVGVEVVGTDINGWDHHIGMGSLDGTINRMLEFTAAALRAFMIDLGPHLDRTVVLLCTEFGRVCKENGNDGTDHGHGGPMWVLGGGVNGGRVYGQWTGLAPSDLNDNRDLQVTTDFRDVFAEVLSKHMKFEIPDGFFPNYSPSQRLGLFA